MLPSFSFSSLWYSDQAVELTEVFVGPCSSVWVSCARSFSVFGVQATCWTLYFIQRRHSLICCWSVQDSCNFGLSLSAGKQRSSSIQCDVKNTRSTMNVAGSSGLRHIGENFSESLPKDGMRLDGYTAKDAIGSVESSSLIHAPLLAQTPFLFPFYSPNAIHFKLLQEQHHQCNKSE